MIKKEKKRWTEYPLVRVRKAALKYVCNFCGFQILYRERYFKGGSNRHVHEKCGHDYDLKIVDNIHQL
jgi:hypothetical protein